MDSYKLELEQFELVKSDWQMEKHSLEGVLMKLRQEVKTRDEKLNAAHIGKVICCVYSMHLCRLCLIENETRLWPMIAVACAFCGTNARIMPVQNVC